MQPAFENGLVQVSIASESRNNPVGVFVDARQMVDPSRRRSAGPLSAQNFRQGLTSNLQFRRHRNKSDRSGLLLFLALGAGNQLETFA